MVLTPVKTLDKTGLVAAVAAYGLWGGFPLYFYLLGRSGSVEVVAHRIVWTLVFCVAGISLIGAWHKVRTVLGDRRLLGTLLGAGVLVSANWLIYIYAVHGGHVVDGALGYFINPLVTVGLAVVFLRERLRPLQVVALGIGVAAVLVLVVGLGRVPWIGLGLAFSFGFYSLVKSKVGSRVSAFVGLGVETLALAPVSVGFLLFLELGNRSTFTTMSPIYALLLIGTGVVTAVPLLLFAVGASRLPLVSLAFIQYLAPIGQFLVGVLFFHELMPLSRWIGFCLIWLALVVLSFDLVKTARTSGQAEQDQCRVG
ncbi:MAG: EamA family transporter RarD [Propionibacteriaceae bacterium]|nr:EamA family transporter RarD [Propionibacteriaceae bacterium]